MVLLLSKVVFVADYNPVRLVDAVSLFIKFLAALSSGSVLNRKFVVIMVKVLKGLCLAV